MATKPTRATHVVVELPLLLPRVRRPRLPLGLRLLRPPLLLRVVDLVDVLVRLDEVHRELAERRRRRIAELGLGARRAALLLLAAGGRGQPGRVQVREVGRGGRRHVDELHGPRGVLRVVQQTHGRRRGARRARGRVVRLLKKKAKSNKMATAKSGETSKYHIPACGRRRRAPAGAGSAAGAAAEEAAGKLSWVPAAAGAAPGPPRQ